MIDELAKELVCNQDPDKVVRKLEVRAKVEQQECKRQITYDLGIAKLILYGLCKPKKSKLQNRQQKTLRTLIRKVLSGEAGI